MMMRRAWKTRVSDLAKETVTAVSWLSADILCAGVMKLCQLEADLHEIPRELFQKRTNSKGEEYWEIHFTLAMTPGSACLLFELEFNGVSYGSVTTKY
jgi:hypothetical protein